MLWKVFVLLILLNLPQKRCVFSDKSKCKVTKTLEWYIKIGVFMSKEYEELSVYLDFLVEWENQRYLVKNK